MAASRLQGIPGAASRQRGWIALVVAICLLFGLLGLILLPDTSVSVAQVQERRTDAALLTAKFALLEYAGSWPRRDTASIADPLGTLRGPGYLPCPDRNDNGIAETGSCGAASGVGAAGQVARLGRLPFLTLGIPELTDGYGNRLWYAVSSKYKANISNDDMGPDAALGTISVRDSSGTLIHDGGISDPSMAEPGGVVAVVIAPGPATSRWNDAEGKSKTDQMRTCTALGCDSNPFNYLERGWFSKGSEDNATFSDRNTLPRTGNVDGFIQGPIRSISGALQVNDRLVFITYTEIQQVMMRRVALEVLKCFDLYATANSGRVPFPAPVCRSGLSESSSDWRDQFGLRFGRVPVPPFNATALATAKGSTDWPSTASDACTLDTSNTKNWWRAWRFNVFIAISERASATGPGGQCQGMADPLCLSIQDPSQGRAIANIPYAVLISGAPFSAQMRTGSGRRFIANFLEGSNAALERMNDLSTVYECSDLTPISGKCGGSDVCPPISSSSKDGPFNDVVLFNSSAK